MKLTTGITILSNRNVEKSTSKKILLANTSTRVIDKKAREKAKGISQDPLYSSHDSGQFLFNPDIRFRNHFIYSPLTNINYRNDLLMFAENKEIKKAVGIVANEVVVMDTDLNRYPVTPEINFTQIDEEKQEVAHAMYDYINDVFYPNMYKWLNFKKEGLIYMIKEFLITGKICYEIIYDSLKNPKDIIGFQPLDPATIQKYKIDDYIYYVEKAVGDSRERILHENQVVLLEWNKYDYGYISYVDGLRLSYNIMRAMQTSKILWFATKSQVRMHIKLALGDVTRDEAIQKLSEMKNLYSNEIRFNDDGTISYNNMPLNTGYREFFTAETASGGHPEIEELTGNGPDLSETDSLTYWDKLFWNDTEIPYDRIDPNDGGNWGFLDVENLRKIEVNFAKFINSIRKMIEDVFIKPIIIQLTLKEVEIGVDLTLLDSIVMKWVAFNQYEKLAELEVLNKKVEISSNITQFGTVMGPDGTERHMLPVSWVMKNFLDFTEDQLKSIEEERIRENRKLGFKDDGGAEYDEYGMPVSTNDTEDRDMPEYEDSYKEPLEDEKKKKKEQQEDEEEETPQDIVDQEDVSF